MLSRAVPISILACLTMAAGCNSPRSVASLRTAVTPHEKGTYAGDPYTLGGLAGNGASESSANAARGDFSDGTVPKDPLLDAPAKGTGLHAGESPVLGRDGHGVTSAPAQQLGPSDVSSPALR